MLALPGQATKGASADPAVLLAALRRLGSVKLAGKSGTGAQALDTYDFKYDIAGAGSVKPHQLTGTIVVHDQSNLIAKITMQTLIVVIGRRRTCKSLLLERTFAGDRVISFQGDEQGEAHQLELSAAGAGRVLLGSGALRFGAWTTRTNDPAILWTHTDNGHGLARGHGLFRTAPDARTGIYGSESWGILGAVSPQGFHGFYNSLTYALHLLAATRVTR